jgi:predicted dehydrogenase
MKSRNRGGRCSRREFLEKISLGAGAAALFSRASFASEGVPQAPKYYQMWRAMRSLPDEEKLGVALVGLGRYSAGQLAPALQETKLCRLAGIVTGTPSKEKEWAERYGIPADNIYNYETFDRIVDNPAIDIVYVVLPNSMHAEYTIRAARAGKHVICEKPMATSVRDCEVMIAACREHGRQLSIGYRLHYEPHHEEVMRLGRQRVLGPVREMRGDFAFNIGNNPNVWRLNRALAGGGPLMDIGVYVVQAALYTVRELPVAVTARITGGGGELFSEVEETIEWELEFPDGLAAQGACSYTGRANSHRAVAADGRFSLQPSFGYGGIGGEVTGGRLDFPQINQQCLQMDAFADHILSGAENRVPGEMGLRDVTILYAIYAAAESGAKEALDLKA